MTTSLALLTIRRAVLACAMTMIVPLSGCAAAAAGLVSATATASSLAVSAVGTATSAVYHVGKAGVEAMTP